MPDSEKPIADGSTPAAMSPPFGSNAPSPEPTANPDAPDIKPPYDAVLVPRWYPKKKVDRARHLALRDELAPLMNDKQVYTRHCGDMSLVTPFKQGAERCHRYWPRGHENDGQEFYAWKDRGDGVMYGVLTEEAKAFVAEEKKANGG